MMCNKHIRSIYYHYDLINFNTFSVQLLFINFFSTAKLCFYFICFIKRKKLRLQYKYTVLITFTPFRSIKKILTLFNNYQFKKKICGFSYTLMTMSHKNLNYSKFQCHKNNTIITFFCFVSRTAHRSNIGANKLQSRRHHCHRGHLCVVHHHRAGHHVRTIPQNKTRKTDETSCYGNGSSVDEENHHR